MNVIKLCIVVVVVVFVSRIIRIMCYPRFGGLQIFLSLGVVQKPWDSLRVGVSQSNSESHKGGSSITSQPLTPDLGNKIMTVSCYISPSMIYKLINLVSITEPLVGQILWQWMYFGLELGLRDADIIYYLLFWCSIHIVRIQTE